MTYEDSCHRIGANALEIIHMAAGKMSPLEEVSELERRLDSTDDPEEICTLENELVAVHLAILTQGEESKKNGAYYTPWRAADELDLRDLVYVGTGRRRRPEVAGYWPSRDLLIQEHRRRLAFRRGMNHDINEAINDLEAKYGAEAT